MPEPIRVLDSQHRSGSSGPWIVAAVITIIAGAIAVILAASGGTTRSAATIPTSLPTPTTLPPAPTTTIGPRTLSQLVPGFQGLVRGANIGPDLEQTAWTWSSGEIAPREISLPGVSSQDASWDASVGLFAAITEVEGVGPALHAGTPTQIQLVADQVSSFAWHVSQPAALAYTTTLPSGFSQLWTTPGPPFSSMLVADLTFEAQLAAYGDWGFVFTDSSPQTERQSLITLDSDGTQIASAPLEILDASGEGQLLVRSSFAQDATLTSVDLTLGPGELIDVGPPIGALFSPNGGWAAVTTQDDDDVVLHLRQLLGPERFTILLGSISARPVAWSNDRQWLVLVGLEATTFEDQLIFTDLTNRTVYTAPITEGVGSFSVDSIAGSVPAILQDA